jgi:oleate hydratase
MANEGQGKQVYFVGGGLASMAGAAYLIRDAGMNGKNIHILEGLPILGGSNDGIGTAQKGFVCRGGRMLNEETYENFWELFYSIPSIYEPGKSVSEEILDFDHAHPTHANARLIDKEGKVLDVLSMGFNMAHRMAMLKLLRAPEEKLDMLKISDWFDRSFFETNFWYMWQTTFAFQEWSSLFEFRRYMNRMVFEFSRIHTLEGVTRTPYNQYDSLIVPIQKYLEERGVDFSLHCRVTDLDFAEGDDITVTAIRYEGLNGPGVLALNEGDLCIVTNASITDSATLGDLHTPAPYNPDRPLSGDLWANLVKKKGPRLGNPQPFFGNDQQTRWTSFTVTSQGNKLLKKIEQFSRNVPGSGALMTFKDSTWRMSIVVAHQPHFVNQPADQTIFWGYGLYPEKPGDFVKKPMLDCTGEEMLIELLHHLHWEDEQEELMKDIINVIPCNMPYIDALFQPRKMTDRPKVVPEGSTNLALISQFVEIPEDMVFTEEYSVRAARIAVYTLMGIKRPIIPVTPYHRDIHVILKAVNTSFR